jgi:hypothetical protein
MARRPYQPTFECLETRTVPTVALAFNSSQFFARNAWDYLQQTMHFTGAGVTMGSPTVAMTNTNPLAVGENVTVTDAGNSFTSPIVAIAPNMSITLQDSWTFSPDNAATVDQVNTETAGQFPAQLVDTMNFSQQFMNAGVNTGSHVVTMSDTSGFSTGQFVQVTDGATTLYSLVDGVTTNTSITLDDAWSGGTSTTATVSALDTVGNPFLSFCVDLEHFLNDGTNVFAVSPTLTPTLSSAALPGAAGRISYLYNHYGNVDISTLSGTNPHTSLAQGTIAQAVGLQVAIWELEYGNTFTNLTVLSRDNNYDAAVVAQEQSDVNTWASFYVGDSTGNSEQATFLEANGSLQSSAQGVSGGQGAGEQGMIVTPTINTAATPMSGTAGVTALNDTATLAGGFNPGGTITFYLFAPGVTPNATDSNNVFHQTVTVNGDGTYGTSGGPVATQAGTYEWVAVYNGDANNAPVSSTFGDEPVVIGPAGPSITTTPSETTMSGGGQFATIGFWHNKNGQAAINGFDSGPSSTLLGNSLASNYPHLFGVSNPYTGTGLAGLTNAQVASVYLSLWTPSGLQKNTYVQAFAVAFGLYAGGNAGTFNVGNNGAAFGVPNGTTLPVTQILQAADSNFNPSTGLFYGGDSTKTSALNNVLDGVNSTDTFGSPGMATGTHLMDSATLSGGVNPGGTITFYLFAPGVTPNATYSNNTYSDVVTVNGDGTYSTASGTNPGGFAATVSGTYQWVAVYSGDGSNQGVTSPFGSEPFTLGQQTGTFFTTPGGSVVIGSGAKLNDSATLNDAFTPTGTITFYLFAPGVTPNATNSNNVYSDVVTVNGNGTYTTATGTNPGGYLPTVTGTYQWVAIFSGDVNNVPDTQGSPFGSEPETVTPAGPSITTTPSATTMTGGGQFATIGFWHNKNGQAAINGFDSGPSSTLLGNSLASNYPHLFGSASPYLASSLAGKTNAQVAAAYLNLWTPSGLTKNTYVQAFAVAFGLYAGGNAGTFNVGNNGAAFGVPNGTTLPVTQLLQAADSNFNPSTGLFYGGDSTKTSALNNVLDGVNSTDTFGSPGMATGTHLMDSATLSGGMSPGGTITFYLFAPGVTPNATYSNNIYSDVVTVSGNGTYSTASGSNPGGFAASVSGTYQWVAVYSGDGSNSGVTSPFGSEPFTLGQQTDTFFTTPGGSVVIGSGAKLTDTATLNDAFTPTGAITFYLFAPGVTPNANNSNNVYSDVVTVNGNGTYTTATGTNPGGYLPTMTGTYQWVAVFSGDVNNVPDTQGSPFGSEPETVSPAGNGTISGTVYCDSNLNGALDSGEKPEAGAIVTLTGTKTGGTSVTQTATSNSSGVYTFSGLMPGTYTVKLTTPNAGDTAELSHSSVVIPTSYTTTLAAGGSSANNNFPEVDYGSLSGTVFLDINDSGIQDSGEGGIANAKITLTGTNYLGSAVSLTIMSDSGGKYSFPTLLPSNSSGYTLTETPPAGSINGVDMAGTINGQTVGVVSSSASLGVISKIALPGCNNAGINYTFGQLGIFHGMTATIGFWHNKNGQALINSFGKTSGGLTLANWLAQTFPNLFGKNAPAFNVSSTTGTNLTGRSDSDVAAYFLSLFGVSGQKSYAQVLATALAVFTTTSSLDAGNSSQTMAKGFGFNITSGGAGAATFTVPKADWPAFGITSSTGATLTISQLLSLANKYTIAGKLNGGNSTLITETNDVFDQMNNLGDIH